MLGEQSRCACCNQAVEADTHTCPECGSHQIKSPFGFWVFCIVTCFALVIALQLTHSYLKHEQQVLPEQQRLFEIKPSQQQPLP